MKIALSGYYGFDNAGDEALLLAISSSIKRLAPDSEFVIFSGCPVQTMRLHRTRAVYYMNPCSLIHELRSSDLLISGGGSIFQDVTSSRSLLYYISVVALARLLRKPVVFYAQGVGPINRPFNRWLLGKVANRVNLITLRDEASREFLHRIGVRRPPLQVTADPVFALQSESADILETVSQFPFLDNKQAKLLGVSVRQWSALDGYQQELARVLDTLQVQGFEILFIPMDYPDDIHESKKVMSYMQQPAHLLEQNLSTKQHLALISRLDLMLGMRLHALIFAASCGVPFAGISYDPKIDAFLALFGLNPLSVSSAAMIEEIQALLQNEQGQNEMRQISHKMREQSEENARLALQVLEKNRN